MFKILASPHFEYLQKLFSFSYLLSYRMSRLYLSFFCLCIHLLSLSFSVSFSFFKSRYKGFQDPYIFTLPYLYNHCYDHINIYNRIYIVITYTHKHTCTHAHTYAYLYAHTDHNCIYQISKSHNSKRVTV